MKAARGLTTTLAVTLIAWLAPAFAAAQASLPAGFQHDVAFGGLNGPTSLEFGPDGKIWVAEKDGLVKVFDGLEDETATTALDLRPKVHSYWDRGLLDIALDPQFNSQPFLYAIYTLNGMADGDKDTNIARYEDGVTGAPDTCQVVGEAAPPPAGDAEANCPVGGRLSRFPVNVATGALGPEQVLVEDWCQQYLSHSIGSIAFDGTGALLASGGDGASYLDVDWGQHGTPENPCGDPPSGVGGPQDEPTAEGGTLRSQDLRSFGPSDPTGLSGSIIRVDRATGAPLPDNPNIGGPDINARRMIAYGFRNPFRTAFRPGTDELWVADVGWADWEEINRVDLGALTEPANYGWPCYEGDERQSSYRSTDLDLCANLYDEIGAALGPAFAYAHRGAVKPGDGCQPEDGAPVSSSISGLDFIEGGVFPAGLDGAAAFADYARGCIWALPVDPDGDPAPGADGGDIVAFDVDAFPVGLTAGPDGALYYADIGDYTQPGGGRIGVIRYFGTGTNQPPNAVITADRLDGPLPLNVDFDGSGSSDADPADDPLLTYAWDFDNNGSVDSTAANPPPRAYPTAGTYTAKLTVTDPAGDSETARVTVQAGNTPPEISIDGITINGAPVSAQQLADGAPLWGVGDEIGFEGTVSDAEDDADPAPGSFVESKWSLIVQHCTGGAGGEICHSHPITELLFDRSGSFTAPDHEYRSYLILRHSGTDSRGLKASDSVELHPRTVDVGLTSSPPGIELVLNNRERITPSPGHAVIEGSRNSVIAPESPLIGGRPYRWVRWEQDGAPVGGTSRTLNPLIGADTTFHAVYELDNDPPTAVAAADPDIGPAPLTVDLDASGSSDPDGDTLTYAWDLDDDGQFDDSASATPQRSFAADGRHTVRLRVSDPDGYADTDQLTIVVDSVAPTLTIDSGPGATNDTTPTFGFSPEAGSTVQCSIDTGTPAYGPCSAAAAHTAATPLAEGSRTFRVRATDAAGNQTTRTRSFTVDTTVPTLTIDSGPGPTNDTTPSFGFTAEAGSAVQCSIDTGTPNYAPCSTSSSHTAGTLPQGSRTFRVRATDAAGNQTTRTRAFTIDTTEPTLTIDSGPNGPTDDTTPSFGFSAEAGATIQCSIDTGTPAYGSCSAAAAHTPTPPLSEGPRTFRVRATDSAGNQTVETRSFTVDTTAPTLTIDSGPGSTNDTTPSFGFSAEAGSTVRCSVDNGTPNFGACSSASSHTAPTLSEGSRTFRVRATDAAGNEATETRAFTVDTTVPTLSIDSGPGPTNDTTPSFGFTSEAGSTVLCSIDTGTPNYGACTSASSHTAPTLPEGLRTFRVRATDAAGNQTTRTRDFTVDTTPPTLAINGGPDGGTNDTTPTFDFIPGSGTTVECSIDTGTPAYGACSSAASHTPTDVLAEGQYSFHVRATDPAGNTATRFRSFTVDVTAPTLTIDSGPQGPTNQSTPTFGFTAQPGSTVECAIDPEADSGDPGYEPCTGASSYVREEPLADGSYTFHVRATDGAGNKATEAQSFIVDATAPELTIDSGPTGSTTDRSPRFVFGAESGATLECAIDAIGGTPPDYGPCSAAGSHTADQPLADGSYGFHVRATDGVGNVATASRSFSVRNDPPVARATATVTGGTAPLEVGFDGSASGDPDGDEIAFAWDLDGDGQFDDSDSAAPRFTYAAGTYAPTLRVTDADGASDTDVLAIEVAAPPPPPAVFRFLRTTARADLRVGVDGGGAEEVRLLGLRVPGGKGSCGVKGARKKLGRLLDRGDQIALGTAAGMPDSDRRGRLIRSVGVGPRDVGLSLVRRGWARVRAGKRFDGIRPYLKAERAAKRKDRGGWRRCDWR